jgi:hypothetical protein
VRPADAKKAYAQACAAHAYYRWRFPGFGQQVPPPDKQAEQRPTDGQVRAFLRGEDVGSCDRCGGLEHVDTGTVVSKGEYERLCRGCWWRATRGVFEQVGIVWERDYVVPREGEVAST